MRIPRILLTMGAVSTLSGCVSHHGYVDPDPLSLCLVGACVGWNVAEATRVDRTPPPAAYDSYYERGHDDHYHGPNCGCASRTMNGHQAYWYHGHWEFFDGRSWFILEGGPSGPSW